MRTYQLYLIKDEFASNYFGRERLFFQLFKEYEEAYGELKSILEKQVQYITKTIQGIKIHQFVKQDLQRNKSFYVNKGTYYIEMAKRSFAKLEIHEKCLMLTASGPYDAETAFFEVLRKMESSFIAIDLEHQRCGWLKPIKERNFV